ncbi:hypothetical protein BC937DRAFT_88086 [Endogone sp. FLAS-F59071]|nr:hypothetical protein BC937DRAFT_88086 [Endogone sp. FLAS-F59071]|eukprot:RUS18994.1 hypothetical protein BC937DRAFT_88086 [Endogone sp. FLAS-F59071]
MSSPSAPPLVTLSVPMPSKSSDRKSIESIESRKSIAGETKRFPDVDNVDVVVNPTTVSAHFAMLTLFKHLERTDDKVLDIAFLVRAELRYIKWMNALNEHKPPIPPLPPMVRVLIASF